MRYKDRQEAGKELAAALEKYSGQDSIVYALPRGGVLVGYEVAKKLRAPLDVIITWKIGHPLQPEYAICVVAEDGHLLCNEEERADLDPAWLKTAIERERQEVGRRRELYLGETGHLRARGKIAIVVDDGIATGLTMLLAIDVLLAQHPKEVVVAVPVTPAEIAEKIKKKGVTLVALQVPKLYEGAVGAYYEDFPQTKDAEAIALLKKHRTL